MVCEGGRILGAKMFFLIAAPIGEMGRSWKNLLPRILRLLPAFFPHHLAFDIGIGPDQSSASNIARAI